MAPGYAFAPNSAEAAFKASWAKPLISPRRSRTVPLHTWRTLALRSLAGIVLSFQVYEQLDGVVVRVSRDAHIVNHVLDQEQAPAARRLLALQFGLKVRPLCFRVRWRAATPVDDAHQEAFLQRPLRQPQSTNRSAHLLRRLPLVARLAGYAQLGERPPGAAPRCRHGSSDLSQGHQGDVILMLPALPNEGVELF